MPLTPPGSDPAASPLPAPRPRFRGRSGLSFVFLLVSLVLLVFGGAAGNLLRVLTWTQAHGFVARPFATRTVPRPPLLVERYAKVELPAPAWRPLRVELDVRATTAATAGPHGVSAGAALDLAIDGVELPAQPITSAQAAAVAVAVAPPAPAPAGSAASAVTSSGTPSSGTPASAEPLPAASSAAAVTQGIITLRAEAAAVSDGLLTLQLSPVGGASAIEIRAIRLTPLSEPWPLLRHGGAGALFGLLAWGLIVWRPRPRPRPRMPAADEAASPRALASPPSPLASSPSSSPALSSSARQLPSPSPLPPPSAAGTPTQPAQKAPHIVRESVAAGLAIFALLAVWALLRPPLQSPDEPHQFLRVTSLRTGAWVAGASTLTFDPRFFNPLTWGAPRLAAITFDPTHRISYDDVAALKATPWPAIPAAPPRANAATGAAGVDAAASPEAAAATAYVAITSYPPLYYASVFAVAQPLASLAAMTPYQAFYLFRLASALLVALAWTAVFVLLRRTPDTAADGAAIVALLVLDPMLAFLSSGITADALSVPLITLTVVCAWRVLSTGQGVGLTAVAALLALFTKPSGLQMAGALIVATIGLVLWSRRQTGIASGAATASTTATSTTSATAGANAAAAATAAGTAADATAAASRVSAVPFVADVTRAWRLVRTLALAAMIAYGSFYAWSPTQFTFEPGHATIGLEEYLVHVIRAVPDVWISFWGYLGWLEYRLAAGWYAALFAVTLLCAWLYSRSPRRVPALTGFLALYALAFVGSTIVGGFINLKVAGYMLQGRYFLPIAIALAPLVQQSRRWQRLLLPASVAVLHLLLMWATVDRYFGGDWALLWMSMPFV